VTLLPKGLFYLRNMEISQRRVLSEVLKFFCAVYVAVFVSKVRVSTVHKIMVQINHTVLSSYNFLSCCMEAKRNNSRPVAIRPVRVEMHNVFHA